jgi:hypothetical protein
VRSSAGSIKGQPALLAAPRVGVKLLYEVQSASETPAAAAFTLGWAALMIGHHFSTSGKNARLADGYPKKAAANFAKQST